MAADTKRPNLQTRVARRHSLNRKVASLIRMFQSETVAQKPAYNRDTNNESVLHIVGKTGNTRIQISVQSKWHKGGADSKQQHVQ
jgi:hypothetical protein